MEIIPRQRGNQPIPYNEAIADQVCDAIATCSKGLGTIVAELNLPISPSLIYKWIQQNDSFRERYARAKADQARVLADEITEIADTTEEGQIITEKPDGKEIKRADMIEHRKLRIESRKWLAAKLLPKVYGDKLAVEHGLESSLAARLDSARKRLESGD